MMKWGVLSGFFKKIFGRKHFGSMYVDAFGRVSVCGC